MSAGIYVRWHPLDDRLVNTLGPLDPDHPVVHDPCPACGLELGTQEHIAMLAIGPGRDSERMAAHKRGLWYLAVAILIHASCAGVGAQD
jgi:hypothetical protein